MGGAGGSLRVEKPLPLMLLGICYLVFLFTTIFFSIYYYIFFYLLLERPLALMLLGICSLGFCSCLYSTLSFPVCCVVFSLRCWCLLWFSPLSFVFLSFFFSLRCWCFFVVFPLVLCVSLVFPKP